LLKKINGFLDNPGIDYFKNIGKNYKNNAPNKFGAIFKNIFL